MTVQNKTLHATRAGRTITPMIGVAVILTLALLLLLNEPGAALAASVPTHAFGSGADMIPVPGNMTFDLNALADRSLPLGIMALALAAMCSSVTGVGRRLRREDSSPRRYGRRT